MNSLLQLVDQLEAFIAHANKKNDTVSAAGVGWHIEHCLLVVEVSVKALKKSDPQDYRPAFSFWRTVTFWVGRFPRGKAKAPKAVQPVLDLDEVALRQHLSETREGLMAIETFNPNQFMKHPIFGHLRVQQAIRFMELHTRHHLTIIKDILKHT